MTAFQVNPATDIELLAESATASFDNTSGGLYADSAGVLEVAMVADPSTFISISVAAGYHPLQIVKLGTNTTVTNVYGLYHR